MNKDVSIDLLEQLEKDFNERVKKNSKIKNIVGKVARGKANYIDCQNFSFEVGATLGKSFRKVLNQGALPNGYLYYNILEKTAVPMLENNYGLVTALASKVAKIIDTADGLGLNAIIPSLNKERIMGILDDVTAEGIFYQDQIERLVTDAVNVSQSYFDDFVRENADFKYQAGMNPQVIRINVSEKEPCAWCEALEGTYDYNEVKDTGNDVWRRHRDCKCQITYINRASNHIKTVSTGRRREKETATARNNLNR